MLCIPFSVSYIQFDFNLLFLGSHTPPWLALCDTRLPPHLLRAELMLSFRLAVSSCGLCQLRWAADRAPQRSSDVCTCCSAAQLRRSLQRDRCEHLIQADVRGPQKGSCLKVTAV